MRLTFPAVFVHKCVTTAQRALVTNDEMYPPLSPCLLHLPQSLCAAIMTSFVHRKTWSMSTLVQLQDCDGRNVRYL